MDFPLARKSKEKSISKVRFVSRHVEWELFLQKRMKNNVRSLLHGMSNLKVQSNDFEQSGNFPFLEYSELHFSVVQNFGTNRT